MKLQAERERLAALFFEKSQTAEGREWIQAWEQTLSATDKTLVQQSVAQYGVGWRANPALMAVHLMPNLYKPYPYFLLLGRKFADAVYGRSRFQIWNLPARYGKSMVGQLGMSWCLSQFPEARLITTSYGASLALENAIGARDILRRYPNELNVTLRADRKAAGRYVTESGGGVHASQFGGQITGFGAGRHGGIIIDDPFKNWQEAHSENRRRFVWETYQTVMRTRLEDETAWIIVIQTRWHEDDLTGMLLNSMAGEYSDQWELVRIPAIAEVYDPNSTDMYTRMPDPLGRSPGEVLTRFTEAEVRARAATLGGYLSSALEQQRPAPEEGGEIKRAWWKWTVNPPMKFDATGTSWDLKLKDTEVGDYVVGQAWGRIGATYWLIDQLRGKWNVVSTKMAMALMQVRHPDFTRHWYENRGNAPEVTKALRQPAPDYIIDPEAAALLGMVGNEAQRVQDLVRRGMSGLIPIEPKGDKSVRLRAVSGLIEAGNVYLPENAPWALTLVNEAASFPNGANDDQLDALSQALKRMNGNETTTARSTRTLNTTLTPAPLTPIGASGLHRSRRRVAQAMRPQHHPRP